MYEENDGKRIHDEFSELKEKNKPKEKRPKYKYDEDEYKKVKPNIHNDYDIGIFGFGANMIGKLLGTAGISL